MEIIIRFKDPQAMGFGANSGFTECRTFMDSYSPSIIPHPLSPAAIVRKYLVFVLSGNCGLIERVRVQLLTLWADVMMLQALCASGITIQCQFSPQRTVVAKTRLSLTKEMSVELYVSHRRIIPTVVHGIVLVLEVGGKVMDNSLTTSTLRHAMPLRSRDTAASDTCKAHNQNHDPFLLSLLTL